MPNKHDNTIQMLIKFKLFIAEYKKVRPLNIDFENLKPKIIEHVYQSDGFNCGIFVLFFIENILNKLHLDYMPESPSAIRLRIKDYIIEYADNVLNTCFECTKPIVDKFLVCAYCLRKTHLVCIFKKWSIINMCDLCQQNQ